MPPARILPQDPSMSPTFAHSTNQAPTAVSPSIRRNLFASHLSRRPVAPASQDPFDSPSPTHRNGHTQTDSYVGPDLQPTKRAMTFQETYDPNISPLSHPISPSTSSTMFPRESIVAVNPVTGKPLLPVFPTLPPRLRLSDGDEAEDDSEEEAEQVQHMDYQRHRFSRSPSYHNNLNISSDIGFDPEMDSSDLERFGMPPHSLHHYLGLDNTMVVSSEDSHRDRERIERLLTAMMARQRARARTIAAVTTDHSTTSGVTSNSHVSSSRPGRTAGHRLRRDMDCHPPSSPQRLNTSAVTDPKTGGLGATMDPNEKDELMGLIMTSLRRKLQGAEEEGWMYGGAEGLGGIGGLGLESDTVGLYE